MTLFNTHQGNAYHQSQTQLEGCHTHFLKRGLVQMIFAERQVKGWADLNTGKDNNKRNKQDKDIKDSFRPYRSQYLGKSNPFPLVKDGWPGHFAQWQRRIRP